MLRSVPARAVDRQAVSTPITREAWRFDKRCHSVKLIQRGGEQNVEPRL
jgi:hypothetical protein